MAPLKISDPFCTKKNSGKPPTRQDVVVNSNQTLRNVIIYVKAGLPAGKKYPLPSEPVVLDQRGCVYEPHVFALRAGQDLKVLNSDSTVHNINAQSQKINFAMISDKVPPQLRTFQKPEMPVKIKCDVHPWMLAWAGVFDHPYFAVTGDDGSFELPALPVGEYTVEAWHEEYGAQIKKVKCAEGQPQTVEFTYLGSAGSPPVAK